MAGVADLTVNLKLNDQGLKSGLASARSDVSKSSSFIKNALTFSVGVVGAQAFTTGLRSVRSGISEVVGAASDMNETVSKVGVVFGQNAGQIADWAKNAANAFGISRQQAEETSATFGNFFQGIGIGVDTATKMSEKMVGLAADLGSFNNIDPAQVLLDLQSAMAGQMEPMRKYGVDLSDASLSQEALSEGIKKTGATWTQQQRALLSYNIILAHTKTAQGDFARTSGGLANQQRILAADIANLKVGIGNLLLPAVLGITDAATRFLARIDMLRARGIAPLESVLRSLHTTLDQTFGKGVGDVIDGVLRGIVDGIGAVSDAVGTLAGDLAAGNILGFFADLGKQGIDLGKIVITGAIGFAGDLLAAAGDLWGWVLNELFGPQAPSELSSLSGGASQPARDIGVGDIIVTGALKLGEGLAAIAGDLWSWVYGQIVGTTGTVVPAGMGSRAGPQGGVAQEAKHVVPFGDIAVEVGVAAVSWATGAVKTITDWITGAGWDATVNLTGLAIDAFLSGMSWVADVGGRVLAWVKSNGWDAVTNLTGLALDLAKDALSWATGTTDLGTLIGNWLDAHGVTATLHKWSLYLNDPSNVNMPDPSGAMTREVNTKDKQSTTALLAKWYLTLQGQPITDASQASVQQSITDYFSVNRIVADLDKPGTWELALTSTPIISQIIGIPKALNDALNAVEPVRGKIDDWNITFADLKDYNIFTPAGQQNFGDWIIGKVRDKIGIPDIDLPSWNLNLPTPNIVWGGGIAGAFGAGLDFAQSILDKIGIPDISLPSWHLHLPTPDFPGLFDTDVLNWIETKIDGFDLNATVIEGIFHLDLPTPDFPNLHIGDVVGWIKDAIAALGDLNIPISNPIHFNIGSLNPLKSGSLLGDIRDRFRGGGAGGSGSDSGLTFTAKFLADTKGVSTAFQFARDIGVAWAISKFTAAFLADIENVKNQANFAWSIGRQWAASAFIDRFLTDIENVKDQANFAWSIGNQWAAQVFTATFAVNTVSIPGGGGGGAGGGGGGSGATVGGSLVGAGSGGGFDYIPQAAAQTGVSASLISSVMQEESGGVWQTSPAGAIGYMQVMPDWGSTFGLNLNDPAQNVLAGAMVLAQNLAAAGGNVYEALRMYHGYGWDGFTSDTQYADIITGLMGGYQHGGMVTTPLALVGERGPELVSLPFGSYVHTAAQTRGMRGRGAGGDVHVHVHGTVYGVDHFQAQVAEAITEAEIVAARMHQAGYAA